MYRPVYLSILTITIIITIIFASCQKSNLISIEGIETVPLQTCLNAGDGEFIIDDTTAYLLLLDSLKTDGDCSNFDIPQINFTEKTLIGKYTEVQACDASYLSDVFADPENKKYIYEIIINADNFFNCDSIISNHHWISVPKLPNSYTVDFRVIEEGI